MHVISLVFVVAQELLEAVYVSHVLTEDWAIQEVTGVLLQTFRKPLYFQASGTACACAYMDG